MCAGRSAGRRRKLTVIKLINVDDRSTDMRRATETFVKYYAAETHTFIVGTLMLLISSYII